MLATLQARLPFTPALGGSMAISITFHVIMLFVVAFVVPKPANLPPVTQFLQVVLVNSKSPNKPLQADALAQANLDGGGNTEENLQATTPLPPIQNDKNINVEQVTKQVKELESESKRVMSQLKSDYTMPQAEPAPQKTPTKDVSNAEDLVQRSLEIARLEAQIDKATQAYQKIPRRKFIGARTQEYRFSQYVEDWRMKVERIGNLNYPEQARSQKLYGKLVLSVSIKADGTLEEVEVSRSSGHRILDAAAVRIVKLAAPYTPLPPDITRDTDILTITRTWTFTASDRLEGE